MIDNYLRECCVRMREAPQESKVVTKDPAPVLDAPHPLQGAGRDSSNVHSDQAPGRTCGVLVMVEPGDDTINGSRRAKLLMYVS